MISHSNHNRRITFIVFMLVLLLSSVLPAFCEDNRFSVRNGIMFGMSEDELVEIEKSKNSVEYGEWKTDENSLYLYLDSLAGIENGKITYCMANDKLTRIHYTWGKKWDSKSKNNEFTPRNTEQVEMKMIKEFNALDSILKNKYELIGFKEKTNYLNYVEIDGMSWDAIDEFNSGSSKIIEFNQYLASDGNDYVVIVMDCYREDTYNEMETRLEAIDYCLEIDYNQFSKEDYDKLINKTNEIQQQRETDL